MAVYFCLVGLVSPLMMKHTCTLSVAEAESESIPLLATHVYDPESRDFGPAICKALSCVFIYTLLFSK